MKRILVATDGSEGGNRALDAAAELARLSGSDLVVLTVGGIITGVELRKLASADGDLSKTLETMSNRIVTRAGKRARRHGMPMVTLRCEWGDPAEAIIDAVRREKADVVVVGRRGRGRLSGLLLGSVSQKVASLAPCAVLVVP